MWNYAEYIVNHVFLPPELPQDDDSDPKKDTALITVMLAAMKSFLDFCPPQEHHIWKAHVQMLEAMLDIQDQAGGLLALKLQRRIRDLNDGGILALHVRSQNAGIVIRRSSDQVSFESFELAPTNKAVIQTRGRLLRSFPGPAVSVSRTLIADPNFLDILVDTLAKLDSETSEEVQPTIIKSGSRMTETRDTVNPRFVSEMLTGVLRAVGQPLETFRITKCTREEVLWDDALKPWKRSPLWLLLRVALQIGLMAQSADGGRSKYKSFMIFLMSKILADISQQPFQDDLLFAMTAKVARRALKLGPMDTTPWLDFVLNTVKTVQMSLAKKWNEVQQKQDPFGILQRWTSDRHFDVLEGTHLTLASLRPYLTGVFEREAVVSSLKTFTPNCSRRIRYGVSLLPDMGILTNSFSHYRQICLADLEHWVSKSLQDWLSVIVDSRQACSELKRVLDVYSEAALQTYRDAPEDFSNMVLVIMELWVAIDKCALRKEPILHDYIPVFPGSFFEPLVLPKRHQMDRLLSVERYLKGREEGAKVRSSIFSSINAADSLSVRYYDQSPRHQDLRRKIEREASESRSLKKQELATLKEQYDSLIKRADGEEHQYTIQQTRRGERSIHNTSNCLKCAIHSQAKSLTISVHEWPLPGEELEARAVAFEIAVPTAISNWRDAAFSILADVFGAFPGRPANEGNHVNQSLYFLHNYDGLRNYIGTPAGRIRLGSIRKSFLVAHYKKQDVSKSSEASICVNHNLQYSMYDSENYKEPRQSSDTSLVRSKCTPMLRSASFQVLQQAVSNTIHTSNEIIASQSQHPVSLTLHESYAFGTLRSGHRLQWRNMARELQARVLNFNREETGTLFNQAAWQVGPLDDFNVALRESHLDLQSEEFGMTMISVLQESYDTIEANWQSAAASRIFTVLAARLLSLTSHALVRNGCLQLLRRARDIASLWTYELNQKLQEARSEEEIKVLRTQKLEMALTCHESFDVDPDYFPTILNTDEDVARLCECSITIHDCYPPLTESLPGVLKGLLRRYHKRMHLFEPHLREQICRDGQGLHKAVQRLWVGHRPNARWTALATPNERWLVAVVTSNDKSASITVHYNLLDGSLLVNGSPLTRLPPSYEADSSYRRLFGERVLDVIPSTAKDVLFETRDELFGQTVYFGMRNSKVIIRTRQSGRKYELIPIDALGKDFPYAFINDYVHWLDLNERIIEWRPLNETWMSSSSHWRMRLGSNGRYELSRGPWALIDLYEPMGQALISVFSPLEDQDHIHISVDKSQGRLEVHLPRLKLDFFLIKGNTELESKQYRGMVIDNDQSIGTLTGLVNKLVLRGKQGPSRIVIIPHGEATFARYDQHVHVRLTWNEQRSYHMYSVDRDLGRLIDNGSLRSKLFLCYLHAMTSNCLADQLTSRTGTEEALSMLRSASIHSFLRLAEDSTDLLKYISQLTPMREYYPPGLKVMQRIRRNALPPLSQHHAFDGLARSILRQANILSIFDDNPSHIADLRGRGEHDLHARAAIRDASFCVTSFGAEDFTTKYDERYTARDSANNGNNREFRVYCTARLVNEWSQDLRCAKDLLSKLVAYRSPIQGIQDKATVPLRFDQQWLSSPAEFLPSCWCTLQVILSSSTQRDKYKIMMCLSTLSYSQYQDNELVETLLAFATIPRLKASRPPACASYDLSQGFSLQVSKLTDISRRNVRIFESCPESHLPSLDEESWYEANNRRHDAYQTKKDATVRHFVNNIYQQWPNTTLSTPSEVDFNTYIDVRRAVEDVQNQFRMWHENIKFQSYIHELQTVLPITLARPRNEQGYSYSPATHAALPAQCMVSLGDLMNGPAPMMPLNASGSSIALVAEGEGPPEEHANLKSLLEDLSSASPTGFEQQYMTDLGQSFKSLCESNCPTTRLPSQSMEQSLRHYLEKCENHLSDARWIVLESLEATTTITQRIALEAKMWPRLSHISLLQCLATSQDVPLNGSWKRCLIRYGIAISAHQRAQRIVAAIGKNIELMAEIRNPGRQGWYPMDYPDWLLFEIENNLCIRSVQVQIAKDMIAPASGTNSVMQLNMGEGKSSVIVPIVAAALADTEKLVRVIVLKPLAPQMFQSLVTKLGGMLNRRIFFMPFSRSIRLDVQQAIQIRQLYDECMSSGGVLLTQPEHLLSFELMGPERLLSSAPEVGRTMIETQRWLDNCTRDILDESDEILSVKFELCYTMGSQALIEYGPHRWIAIHHVLGLIRRFACKVLKEFPEGLEILATCPGSFPRIRILQTSAGEYLTTMIAQHLRDEGMQGLNVWNRSRNIRELIFRYLTDTDMARSEAELLQSDVFSDPSVKNIVQLLRGLIAGRVLLFAFEHKRWRVNYGLDLSRTMLSVPYRAKDIPATRAEFSHPDTTILLTCLSYYYGGLSNEQLHNAFELLLLSDQAQDEYDIWVQDAPNLPSSFRQLTGINLSDQTQCHERVYPCLKFAKSVVDFYLSRIVFPREMQEFPQKMSSSGWDIAKTKRHTLTGFSGTNDSRYVLPLSVSQCDLPEQLHTNAAVLSCLLRKENTFQPSTSSNGKTDLDAASLLKLVIKSSTPVRVILDVGAQVLELTNDEVARSWLTQVDPAKAQAVVFFDDRNELSVMTRDLMTESFSISPYAKQMDQCLVYLDESHTRGTDLKLPTDYRAAVTLGPSLTKDRLVQACMRMRKLGKGQSVMFCAPKEIERQILHCTGKSDNRMIGVADVLKWSIQETCISTKKSVPLWAVQGLRHQHREVAWPASLNLQDSTTMTNAAKRLLEPEAKSLDERYGLTHQGSEEAVLLHGRNDISLQGREDHVQAIRDKCRSFGMGSFNSAKLHEEQERELSPENEKERELERPQSAKPLAHKVYPDVKCFIITGKLSLGSRAFQPAFSVMECTSAGRYFEKDAWSARLLVTRDFALTVEAAAGQNLDAYLRPVHWIAIPKLQSAITMPPYAVILSPFEANELIPLVRLHKAVTLHVYSPRVNTSVRSIEDLTFCAVPPFTWTEALQPIVMELNLFAGQLYLSSYTEYLLLCQYLGLCSSNPKDGVQVHSDGFIERDSRSLQGGVMATLCRFERGPVEFLRRLMALRRKGQDFKRSHMGALLHGELLKEERFGK